MIEATTGGLIGASLLSLPGASRFFISSCVVYSGRGYKEFLPKIVLEKSGVLMRDSNYKDKSAYVESKRLFVSVVAREMKYKLGADWVIVESGTSGPDFYIPGVTSGFTAIGIAGPNNFDMVQTLETNSSDREQNMWSFTRGALNLLNDSLETSKL